MSIFIPLPDHREHVEDEERLVQLCNQYRIGCEDVPHYYDSKRLDQFLSQEFSKESLFLRTMPDKIILTKPPIFIDVKTTFRKDTGNVSIELSSFFYTIQRASTGLGIYYFYLDENGQPLVFNPKKVAISAIYIQPKWFGNTRMLWEGYAQLIMAFCGNVPIIEKATGGSQDPFVLIPKKSLNAKAIPLYKALQATGSWGVVHPGGL